MIEGGQLHPAEVYSFLAREPVIWARLVATRVGEDWHETHLEVTSGVAPARWTAQAWDYDEAIFRALETDGATVATWLRHSAATLDGLTVTLPPVPNQTIQWYRRSSRQAYGGFETLAWPMDSYQLAPQPLATGPGSGSLIGHGPSFVRFAEAVASFLGVALGPGSSVDHMAPTFQRQDLSGRIVRVRLESADVEVILEGGALGGMSVELAASSPGPTEVLSDAAEQTVRFPLPSGLPEGAWIVLKRGSAWFDRKFINYPNTLNPDPGVEIAVEPTTELMALVSGGEGAAVEFKRVIPGSGTDLREKVCRTIAAFANGDGGHVLFGVGDDGTVVGLGDIDAHSACDTVARFVSSIVTPVPGFRVDSVDVDTESEEAMCVVVVTVDQGGQPPYGVNPANPRYYIRRGATTFPASSDQGERWRGRGRRRTQRRGGTSACPGSRWAWSVVRRTDHPGAAERYGPASQQSAQ